MAKVSKVPGPAHIMVKMKVEDAEALAEYLDEEELFPGVCDSVLDSLTFWQNKAPATVDEAIDRIAWDPYLNAGGDARLDMPWASLETFHTNKGTTVKTADVDLRTNQLEDADGFDLTDIWWRLRNNASVWGDSNYWKLMGKVDAPNGFYNFYTSRWASMPSDMPKNQSL